MNRTTDNVTLMVGIKWVAVGMCRKYGTLHCVCRCEGDNDVCAHRVQIREVEFSPLSGNICRLWYEGQGVGLEGSGQR